MAPGEVGVPHCAVPPCSAIHSLPIKPAMWTGIAGYQETENPIEIGIQNLRLRKYELLKLNNVLL